MHVVIFEDHAVERLGVLVAARPACALTIGTTTLVGMLDTLGVVRPVPRRPFAAHASSSRSRGVTLWGMPPWHTHVESLQGAPVLAVNARLVPTARHLALLRALIAAGRSTVVTADGVVAAALVLPASAADGDLVRALLERRSDAAHALAGREAMERGEEIRLLVDPHDVVTEHERAIEDDLAARIDAGRYAEERPGLHVAPGGHVDRLVVVRRGPVVVESGAEIGPFVCLDGPVWVGPEARIHPHAWIRPGTSIGRGCRVGGEVEATVFEPFANKPHEGFVGHSHVGSWVNLAAGTITGNLKSTYGEVRLHDPRPDGSRTTVHTGRQFLGALVGDLVRSQVGTLLPCGARIGMAATIGGSVPDRVPPFFNMLMGGPGGSQSTPDQAATILSRMMARRGIPSLPADLALLTELAGAGSLAAGEPGATPNSDAI
jgi:glucose-1-phosphate thymidylyltransferase